MKRLFVVPLAILVGLSFTGLSFAQAKPAEKPAAPKAMPAEEKAAPAEKPAAKPKAKFTRGEVVSADPAAKTLVVKTKDKELSFSVEEKAAKVLADLKAGDQVSISYSEVDGKLTAKSVRKVKMAAKKPVTQ